jgi:hypothetical protein
MMKRTLFVVFFALSLALSGQAFAQDDGEERTRFYDFENMLIDGEFVSPDLEHMQTQGRAQFDRLLNLQTSFIPKVEESAAEPSLR